MALPAALARRWSHRRMRVLSCVLALGVLLPVGLLVVDLWQDLAQRQSSAARELNGIEYARALTDVTMAVTAVQAATVAGRPAPAGDLTAALADISAVDDRYGEELRVRERWEDLHARIAAEAAHTGRATRASYDAYREVTSLLLDLGDRLRDTSGLIRDVDEVVYYLQDSGIEELPEAVVAAGRLVDLVTMALAQPPGKHAAANTEISVARVALLGPVRELEFNLQSAMESSQSRSLGSLAISLIDRFVRATDNLLAAVPADGRVVDVDITELAELRQELLTAAVELRNMLLDEMESLISARMDELTRRQLNAAAAGALALLLTMGVLLSNLAAGRRQAPLGPPAAAANGSDAVELARVTETSAHEHADREPSGVR